MICNTWTYCAISLWYVHCLTHTHQHLLLGHWSKQLYIHSFSTIVANMLASLAFAIISSIRFVIPDSLDKKWYFDSPVKLFSFILFSSTKSMKIGSWRNMGCQEDRIADHSEIFENVKDVRKRCEDDEYCWHFVFYIRINCVCYFRFNIMNTQDNRV